MIFFTRYSSTSDIPKDYFKNEQELSGLVTSIGDGDGFRFYHQPLFSCSPPNIPREEYPSKTLRVRLAGIDAPEIGHDGRPSQPFAEEARDYLRSFLKDHNVTIKLHGVDQYDRVIASIYVRKYFFWRRNLSLELVKAGLATTYKGRGAHYGGIKDDLFNAEMEAKRKKKGIWSLEGMVTPAEYKRTLGVLPYVLRIHLQRLRDE